MVNEQVPHASLDLTHVLYDSSSHLSLALALITLSPILLMSAYAALAVQTRELVVINMWAGQLACEGFNWILKRAIKQDRPPYSVSNGYGFPSSHSQWMGYFSTFLMCHIYFRHRFATTGIWIVDRIFRLTVYIALIAWAGTVCYSRYHLTYHSPHQILWGLGLGVAFGALAYGIAELLPTSRPQSLVGRLRHGILEHPVARWVRLRDGWEVWGDGGREEEWQRWQAELERKEGRKWRESRVSQGAKKRT